jgi:transcriptional regulator GlxA family with amidase domain
MPTRTRPDAGSPIEVLVVAIPETAGSALYGMVDVLSAAGSLWQTLVSAPGGRSRFRVRIVSERRRRFACGNGIPVVPDYAVADKPRARIVVLPEIWLRPDESLHGRYPELLQWVRRSYAQGAFVYSACSGAVMLAETGLLDGCEATSHWAYADLFRKRYPAVTFRPAPNLVFADREGRIVTAGGTTSWHDLALRIIARHVGAGEALRIAKVYLLKWHDEGQLPFTPLVRTAPHGDSAVRRCQDLLGKNFRDTHAIRDAIASVGIPERTIKRRFRAATGSSFIEYVQNLRIEEAKRLLETTARSADEIGADVGYEDLSFFRRLFKRLTGLRPGEYRRMFENVGAAGQHAARAKIER